LPQARHAAYRNDVIDVQMAAEDLTRLRFGYSPLAEALASLNMLHSGRAHPPHRRWAEDTRHRLRALDTTLLRAIAPPGHAVLTPPVDLSTPASAQHQLRLVADWPPHQLRAELETVWCGRPMATVAREVIGDGPAGARRVAAALTAYWDTALAPHWDRMRAVLEADIACRARHAALSGISAMMNDLHPQLQLDRSTIHLAKTFPAGNQTHQTGGTGVLLMPTIFGGPQIRFDPGTLGRPAITYSSRELHTAWDNSTSTTSDPVSALIGKGRTAILRNTALPATTTDLARELHLSGATVSVHLTILKRCGMVTSWRSGHRVFYQRTPLATSILTAASNPHPEH
jgi:DNA-binding transcriptional ArsR family regulator